ncbi:AMP phosphorylase [Candidatus Woesearchaeota archaeon]|nr:AMP phosphorylase [Candidatus Woesearchaeota archaeon]
MKLKVKDMDIATGGVLIAILNIEDAKRFDLYPEDRITIRKGKKMTTAVVNVAESRKAVSPGKIGLFEEVIGKIKAKQGDNVDIDIQEKPKSIALIKKKLDGHSLTAKETDTIVKHIVQGRLTDIELAYYIASGYMKPLELGEIVALTKSMVKYGGHLKFNKKFIIDKHCSGGVPGNRTTMILVPILAAAGLTMPKTSSRSITSPAGTADTMEVLAPVSQSLDKIKKIVKKTNGCIVWGGAVDLAAADDKMIRVRHSMSIDPEGMLLSSILAKKAAVGSTHVLIDIPLGKDTKIKTKKEAVHLKRMFIKIGKRLGMKVKVIITDGTEPIGNGSGPVLEARDALYIFRRDEKRPLDLEKKSVMMAAEIMKMVGIKDAKKKARQILDSGIAYVKMKEIIKAQGGNPDIDPDKLRLGKYSYTYKSPKSGTIYDIDNITIAKMARIAGAPRDKEAGVYLYKHERQKVKRGEKIFTIYSDSKVKLNYALNILKRRGGITIG